MSEYMLHICPTHNVPLVEKGGISKKTGKSYHFWGCPTWAETQCDYTEKEFGTVQNNPQKPQFSKQDFEQKKQENINKAIENKEKSMLYFNSLNNAIAKTDKWDIKEIEKKRDELVASARAWFLENSVEDGSRAWDAKKQESYNHTSQLDDINAEEYGANN